MNLADVLAVYQGSDGDATKALYAQLARIGPVGEVALNLFRAQKNSERAKVYRGGVRGQGSYRGLAYDRKQWAIDNLTKILQQHAAALQIRWGWGEDDVQTFHRSVLYVDLPTGQVSFHSDRRGSGPDYPGKWDGVPGQSPGRICTWCAQMLSRESVSHG